MTDLYKVQHRQFLEKEARYVELTKRVPLYSQTSASVDIHPFERPV